MASSPHLFGQCLWKTLKKTIVFFTMVKPGGGGWLSGLVVRVLRLFFPCSKLICVAQGTLKTYFVLIFNFIHNMFSKLFDHVDVAFHLIKLKMCRIVSLCFSATNLIDKFKKICVMPYSTTQLIQNTAPQKII